jgi:hypothetical protein
MKRNVFSFNRFHLGDNLIFLHLLRALAKQNPDTEFIHFCHGLDQLSEVVADIENIVLCDFENPLWGQQRYEAINTWKNHLEFWTTSPCRWDWSKFQLGHHAHMVGKMCIEGKLQADRVTTFTCREQLLFDYPALQAKDWDNSLQIDFLIGDSAPCSGQFSEWADHSKAPFDALVEGLQKKGFSVQRTSDWKKEGLTISHIGALSTCCTHHIMVPNGPFWPTLNTYNHHHHQGCHRIVLLDNGENLNMPGITQMRNMEEVLRFAEEKNWI